MAKLFNFNTPDGMKAHFPKLKKLYNVEAEFEQETLNSYYPTQFTNKKYTGKITIDAVYPVMLEGLNTLPFVYKFEHLETGTLVIWVNIKIWIVDEVIAYLEYYLDNFKKEQTK